MCVGQEMMETAASRYHPKKYEGRVLLLLAAKRPSYVNLLPGGRKSFRITYMRSMWMDFIATC